MKLMQYLSRYIRPAMLCPALAFAGCRRDSPVGVPPVTRFLAAGELKFSATSPTCSVQGSLDVDASGQAVARLVLRTSTGAVTSSHPERAILSSDGDGLALEFLDENIAGPQRVLGKYVVGPPESVEGGGFRCSPTSDPAHTVTLSWRLQ